VVFKRNLIACDIQFLSVMLLVAERYIPLTRIMLQNSAENYYAVSKRRKISTVFYLVLNGFTSSDSVSQENPFSQAFCNAEVPEKVQVLFKSLFWDLLDDNNLFSMLFLQICITHWLGS